MSIPKRPTKSSSTAARRMAPFRVPGTMRRSSPTTPVIWARRSAARCPTRRQSERVTQGSQRSTARRSNPPGITAKLWRWNTDGVCSDSSRTFSRVGRHEAPLGSFDRVAQHDAFNNRTDDVLLFRIESAGRLELKLQVVVGTAFVLCEEEHVCGHAKRDREFTNGIERGLRLAAFVTADLRNVHLDHLRESLLRQTAFF